MLGSGHGRCCGEPQAPVQPNSEALRPPAQVFGGGPVLTANPEPYADFFDVVLLGREPSSMGEAWGKPFKHG